jgi:hypothetical protein
MTENTNRAVNEAVCEAMHVDWYCAVDRAVRMGVYWAMYDAVRVDNAVRGAVDGAVYEGRSHPGLLDFLLEVKL